MSDNIRDVYSRITKKSLPTSNREWGHGRTHGTRSTLRAASPTRYVIMACPIRASMSSCCGPLPSPRAIPARSGYIASWLSVLRNDKRFIFSAAAHAQRAADYLHGLQPKQIELERAAA